MTVQGPVKEQQPDGMSHRGGHPLQGCALQREGGGPCRCTAGQGAVPLRRGLRRRPGMISIPQRWRANPAPPVRVLPTPPAPPAVGPPPTAAERRHRRFAGSGAASDSPPPHGPGAHSRRSPGDYFIATPPCGPVCRPRHDQMEQGPTEPRAGCGTFLLSSGGAGITEWPLVWGPFLLRTSFPARR